MVADTFDGDPHAGLPRDGNCLLDLDDGTFETPSNPASFMARNLSRTVPFMPMVESMMALRRWRLAAAAGACGRKAAVAAASAVIFRKERR
jgi:hypothetical protein